MRQRKARLELVRAATTAGQKAHDLTKQLELLDEEKRTLIAGAKFPVDGMGFGDEGITLNGLPLEQASSAEQLRASFAMCAALNPELRVALIRDGSLLDDDSFALIEEMALADDMQVWVEVVGKAGECSVLIEDGEASGPDAEVAHG